MTITSTNPVAEHFNSIFSGHFKDSQASIISQYPVLPVMLISMLMLEPANTHLFSIPSG
jgi:hypothetical protein